MWDMDLLLENFDNADVVELGGFDDLVLGEPDGDLITENPGDTYKETHSVIVICSDSDEQELIYNCLLYTSPSPRDRG